MFRVVLKDGDVREYEESDYTDYDWRKEALIVMNGNRWISIFNWDCVKEAMYIEKKKGE